MAFQLTLLLNLILQVTSINVKYLKRVERLMPPDIIDNYFLCSAMGEVIQWGINSTSLGGYGKNEVGNAVASSKNDYNFTTTLVLARPLQNKTLALKSILILSFNKSVTSNLLVSCTNNIAIVFTDTGKNPMYINSSEKTMSSNGIALHYVLNTPFHHVKSTVLYIFECQTDSLQQNVGTNIRAVGFNSDDEKGITRNVLSNDKTLVNFQAILNSRNEHGITSMVFVISKANFTLICSFGSNMVQLQSLPDKTKRTLIKKTRNHTTAVSGLPEKTKRRIIEHTGNHTTVLSDKTLVSMELLGITGNFL